MEDSSKIKWKYSPFSIWIRVGLNVDHEETSHNDLENQSGLAVFEVPVFFI